MPEQPLLHGMGSDATNSATETPSKAKTPAWEWVRSPRPRPVRRSGTAAIAGNGDAAMARGCRLTPGISGSRVSWRSAGCRCSAVSILIPPYVVESGKVHQPLPAMQTHLQPQLAVVVSKAEKQLQQLPLL